MRKFGRLKFSALVLLLLHSFAIENTTTAPASRSELYNEDDNIELLNVTNIKSTIYESKNAWIVEFYNRWCGHCQRFAPIWKELASNILNWKDIIRIAAIDCANENNTPTCREFEVTAYPSIRFFQLNARPDSLGVDLKQSRSLAGLKTLLINQLEKEQQEGRGQTWPNIIPYKTADTANLWKSASSSTNHIFLIFEEIGFTLGAEVILDFHNIKNIHIRRVYSDNQPLCIATKVTKFPSLVVLNRDNSQTKINIKTPTREFLVDAIKEFLGISDVADTQNKPEEQIENNIKEEDKESVPNATETTNVESSDVEELPDLIYQVDLENALRYSLYHEIPLNMIDGEKLVALKHYLKLLRALFPFGKKGRDFMGLVSSEVDNKSSVTSKQYMDILNSAETEYNPVFPETLTWVGCKGSSQQYRGYPCGMWSMFHMLTVNYENTNEFEDPAKVLKVMHGYIKNFFGCWDCSQHFLEMAERRKLFDVKTKDEAILWLWKAHNEVNKRLSGDITEDPFHKKIQYPSTKHCSSCRFENGSWNDMEVLNYLKNKYSYVGVSHLDSVGKSNLQSDDTVKSKTKRSSMTSDEYVVKRRSGWDFTIFDISICVVLYIVSTVILMLVCIKFAVKKSYYRKKAYVPSFLTKA